MANNVLLEKTLRLIPKKLKGIHSSRPDVKKPRWKVTYTFEDGTTATRIYKCDRQVFLKWWKETTAYLREMWQQLHANVPR